MFLCEGADPADGFDAKCYRQIFGESYPDIEFVSVGSAKEVEKGGNGLASALGVVVGGITITRIIDGDDHTEDERVEKRKEGTIVLRRRNIESYLLGDEVLSALCESRGQPDKSTALIAARDKAVADRGGPADDMKVARQSVREFARNRLGITQVGDKPATFLVECLAPLITPATQTYKELLSELFGEMNSD